MKIHFILLVLLILFSGAFFIFGRVTCISYQNNQCISPVTQTIPPKTPDIVAKKPLLIFPAEATTIKESKFTIIGKIYQDSRLIIDPDLVYEKLPYNENESAYFLKFNYGETSKLLISLDGTLLGNAFVTPQYPTLKCKSNNKIDCLQEFNGKIPPVIFFVNVDRPLTKTIHKIAISFGDNTYEYPFWYDEQIEYSKRNLPTYELNFDKEKNQMIDPPETLLKEDNCSSGYTYPANYLHIPIPDTSYVYNFSISLPDNAKGLNLAESKVYIAYNDKRYNLLIPNYANFFSKNPNEPYLYLPTELLVYANGKSSKVYVKDDNYYSYETFYLIPQDNSQNEYILNALPWATISWSGCDG